MATQEEALRKLWGTVKDNPQRKAAFEEMARREGVDIAAMQKPAQEEFGVLDYLMGIAEPAVTLATGAIAEPISGLAGMVAAAVPGGEPAEVVKGAQEMLTYTPRTKGGIAGAEMLGKVIEPVAKMAEAGSEYLGEAAYKEAGPIAGAIAKSTPAIFLELLGLKGTKGAKKMALRQTIEKSGRNVSELYDEVGALLPEIKQGLSEVGISEKELKDILPVQAPEEVLRQPIERIGGAVRSKGVRPSKEIAEEIKPSQEILTAAEDFGLSGQLLPSHYAQNPTYRAIEQGLKSIPGSQLAAREKQLMSGLALKADELIEEFGGTIDKSGLSDLFRTKSQVLIGDLEKQASEIYNKVNNEIPRGEIVKTDNITSILEQEAKDLGGVEYLTSKESELFNVLNKESKPTYARLDKYRKQIGDTLGRKSDVFKDSDTGTLKRLYGALANDQQAVAKTHKIGDLYKSATDLVISRKGIEDQLVKSLGKQLSGSITSKASPAMLALQKGNTKQFDELLDNIPDEVGSDIRKSIVASSLNDAFVQGSRAERALNVPGFDDFMKGLKRHKGAYSRVEKEIGSDAMNRLETFHKIVGGVREAQKEGITTGRIAAVPRMFDESGGIAQKLYGKIESTTGLAGVRPPGLIENILTPKTPRSIAADEFLASPRFRRILDLKLKNKLETESKISSAEKKLAQIKEYKAWKKTLTKEELKDLSKVGAIGYLTGGLFEEKEKEKQ